MTNDIINQSYKNFHSKLREYKRKRNRALRRKDKDTAKEYSEKINKIIEQMQTNNIAFASITGHDIYNSVSSERAYDRIADEKDRYAEKAGILNEIAQKDYVTDDDIKALDFHPVKRVFGRVMLSVSIVAALAGVGSLFFKKKTSDGPKEDPKQIVQENPDYTEDEEEYIEKDGTMVKFGETEENDETNSNTNAPSTSNNSNGTQDNKNQTTDSVIGVVPGDEDNKDDKDKKDKKDKDNKDKDNKDDKNNEDSKDQDNSSDEKDNTENNQDQEQGGTNDDDFIHDEEIEVDSEVVEQDPPAVPGDMPIEEDQNNKENDEHYYDKDGNETSKDEAEKEKDKDLNGSKTPSDSSNNKTESGNSSTEEKPAPGVSGDMGIEEDKDADEHYYDKDGNEISKEQAEQEKAQDLASTKTLKLDRESLIQRCNELKSSLIELQSFAQSLSASQDTEVEENSISDTDSMSLSLVA